MGAAVTKGRWTGKRAGDKDEDEYAKETATWRTSGER